MMFRVAPIALLAAAVLSFNQALSQTPSSTPPTFTISGTVVEHGSDKPLKDAVVDIASVVSGEFNLAYRTGDDGRFTFTQLQPGKYSLSAHKRGFPHQTFQQNGNYSTAIAAGPELDSTNVVFPLHPGGSITGTILDEENEPIRQAQVLLFKRGVFFGAPQILVQGQRGTDSAGQFRFSDLNPGTYFVAVHAVPWYAQHLPSLPQVPQAEQTSSSKELDVVYPFTYYPGAVDPASASPITVAEGGTSNLQITLRTVPALHVQVTGLQIKPEVGMGMMVTQLGVGGYRSPSNAQVNFNNNGVEITGIAPGRYMLSPVLNGAVPSEQLGNGIFDLTADQSIDVSAFARSSLTGHIVFEGSGPPPTHATVILIEPGNQAASVLSVAPDGSLKLAGGSVVAPGRYHLQLQNAPGFYLKSVEAKGAAVSAGQLDIPLAGSAQLSLVAATGMTNIKGIALKDRKPFGGAMVLLIPKDSAHISFIGQDQSDSDGTFEVAGVPPGRYTLVAIDNGHDLLYLDPAVMKPYLSRGKEVAAPLPNSSPATVEVLPRQTPVSEQARP